MMLLLGETNYLQVSQLRRGLESETARLAATDPARQLERLRDWPSGWRDEPGPGEGGIDGASSSICSFARRQATCCCGPCSGRWWPRMNRFIGTMYVRIVGDEDQARQLHEAHLEIVQALAEGDENAAIQGIWRHFQVVEEAILTMP